MSDGQQRNFPERKKTALDHNKIGLSTKCPTAEGKISKLSWGFNKNNPRITVYTGDPADESSRTNNGRIQGELDTPHLYATTQFIREAIKAEPGHKAFVECWNFIFPGGQRSKEPVNTAKLIIGKDKEGVVYLSLIDPLHKDRPVIKFDLVPGAGNKWIRFIRGDGTEYTRADASLVFAEGYAKMLENIYGGIAITEYVPYVPQNKQGGGGGGFNRGGQGGGGGGGYQQRGNSGGGYGGGASGGGDVAGGDDDLPF